MSITIALINTITLDKTSKTEGTQSGHADMNTLDIKKLNMTTLILVHLMQCDTSKMTYRSYTEKRNM